MTNSFWLIIGFCGQALFSGRFIIQWLASEKQRQSIIPKSFWYFSIAGSLTLLSYALYRRDPIFILGQCFGVIIYLRNIYFIQPSLIKPLITVIAVFLTVLLSYLFSAEFPNIEQLRKDSNSSFWYIFGFIGQLMFSMRFILQWLESEKQKKSVMPVSFWYLSLFGSLILLAYALYKKDAVFIMGQSFGMVVYLRNLNFIFKKKNESPR